MTRTPNEVSSPRRWIGVAMALSALAASTPGPATAAAPRPVALVVVNVAAVALGYRASELIHRPVHNSMKEEIGRIDDLVVGRDKVWFAIISVGGFLGLGDRKVAVPYNSLTVTAGDIVLPGASKQALGRLTEFKYAP